MNRYVPLPARISRLNELAYDLWWSWNAEARDVFRYDLHAARLLAQGCDLWLSMPPAGGPAPLGALKAAINGVPTISIEPSAQDATGARAFYRRLEEDIVPAFYRRDRAGVPVEWVGRVRQTVSESIPAFSARRVVKSTTEKLYNSALRDV